MIKVLLIEDNKLALDYLKDLIQWESYGFEIVSTALNGEEGFKRYIRFKPQLIITDIQMPVMSGIEVARRIREVDKDVKIIFLSSYKEFDYCRAAIDFKVSNYIMKHEINEESLIKKLKEMKSLIDEEGTFRNFRNEFILTENVIKGTPTKISYSESVFLKENHYNLILIERDHPIEVIEDILPKKLPAIEEAALKNICYELDEQVSGVVPIKGDLYLLIIPVDVKLNRVDEFTYKLKELLEAHFRWSFSIFIIGENIEFEKLREIYSVYKDIINYRYFTSTSAVINSLLLETSMCSAEVQFDLKLVKDSLKKGDEQSIHKLIDLSFLEIIRKRDYQALLKATQFFVSILKPFDGEVISLSDGKQFVLFKDSDVHRLYTAKGIAGLLKEKFTELCDLLYRNEGNEYSSAVNAAVKYICKNYKDENLSVEDIAEHVNLSVKRIGFVFKKEIGKSIRGYINWYRIEKSKELIGLGLKMYQIHSEVGYMTSQYFSKVFRKVTGMTPMKYKIGREHEDVI